MRKAIFVMLLLTGVAMVASAGFGYWLAINSQIPDLQAQPAPTKEDLREILDSTTTTTQVTPSATPEPKRPSTTTTTEPAPEGDRPEATCAEPVALSILLSSPEPDLMVSAPVDVKHSPDRWYPAKNRLEIYVSEKTGLPCSNSNLPVRVLGHKQDQFCSLVREGSLEHCDYGVSLGDSVLVELADESLLLYRVVEPLGSEVATPLSEVYHDFYTETGEQPTPAVMFAKFDPEVYNRFYEEAFLRDDASDELWLFTSCGRMVNGHSQYSCAVRTEFVRTITVEQRTTGVGG